VYSIEIAGDATRTPTWYTRPGNRPRIVGRQFVEMSRGDSKGALNTSLHQTRTGY
jgi:hypothetical protein